MAPRAVERVRLVRRDLDVEQCTTSRGRSAGRPRCAQGGNLTINAVSISPRASPLAINGLPEHEEPEAPGAAAVRPGAALSADRQAETQTSTELRRLGRDQPRVLAVLVSRRVTLQGAKLSSSGNWQFRRVHPEARAELDVRLWATPNKSSKLLYRCQPRCSSEAKGLSGRTNPDSSSLGG